MGVDDDAAAVQQPDHLGVCSTATSIGGADLAQEEAAAAALPKASRAATASFEGGNRSPPRLEGSAFGGEPMDAEHDSSSPTSVLADPLLFLEEPPAAHDHHPGGWSSSMTSPSSRAR